MVTLTNCEGDIANAFILHAGLALHEHGFRGQMVPSHSDGLLRLYVSKDETGVIGICMRTEYAVSRADAGCLSEMMRLQAAFASTAWDAGFRDPVIGPAADLRPAERGHLIKSGRAA